MERGRTSFDSCNQDRFVLHFLPQSEYSLHGTMASSRHTGPIDKMLSSKVTTRAWIRCRHGVEGTNKLPRLYTPVKSKPPRHSAIRGTAGPNVPSLQMLE